MADNMRHFLLTSFVALALFVGFGTHVPVAHATTCSDSTGAWGTWDPAANNGKGACVVTSLSPAQQLAAQNSPTDSTTNANTSDKGYNSVMIWIMGLFAWLLGVAALTLDYAVYYTVISMGTFVHNLTAVGVTWRILRDIGNILLIFGFLAIGISIILNNERLGYGKKMLPMLLLAAVFLNFSLFFSEAIVDVGNLFATQFYTQINGGQQPTALSLQSLSVANEGISNKIMAQLGLQTIYGNATDPAKAQELFKAANPTFVGFMGIILFLVTAFVMFSLAFILIARFITLLFLIIVAPVGFAGMAVPKLNGIAKQWWGMLFDQALTAPALLLLLYIALSIITDVHFLTGFGTTSTGADAATGFVGNANLPGFASFILSFLVAMGLLFAVVIFAKKLGAVGAGLATKGAGALTFGATAWGMNRTVGRGAYHAQRRLRQSKTFNALNAATGRVMTRGLDRAATGSFDIRGTGALKNLPGGGIDAGAAQKGGFTGARKKTAEDHEAEVKRIETAHKEGFNEKDEREAIARATAEAEGKHTAIKQIYGEVKPVLEKKVEEQRAAIAQYEQQVAQLEADEQRRTKFGAVSTPEDLRNLATARENLATTKASLAANETSLGEATKKLSDSAENLKKVTEEAQKTAGANALKANIKESKLAYAEGISHPLNPITFVAYGPGGSAAVKKIKESLKDTSKEKKAYEAMKAAFEEESKKEEKKPETEH
ncbi:MAG: hypothetical protein ACYCZZ_02150 [Minisyncoccota bacterium]